MLVFGRGNKRIEDDLIVKMFFSHVCTAHIIKGEATVAFFRGRRVEFAFCSVAVLSNRIVSTFDMITKARLAQTNCIVNQPLHKQDATANGASVQEG